MTYDDFLTLAPEGSENVGPALAALALDRAGRWETAHERANSVDTPATNRVHAYLHRKEGDLINARYWYRRVAEPLCEDSLDVEWSTLVHRFLAELDA